MPEEMSEEAIIAEATARAIKAFDDYLFNVHNLDPAYWGKRIVIRHVGSDFKYFLKEQTYDDRGGYEHETE